MPWLASCLRHICLSAPDSCATGKSNNPWLRRAAILLSVPVSGMKSVPVVIPDNETIEKFNAFCTPIFQQQEVLEAENSRLSDIRDALLPMLMSGELDVSDINL